MDYVETQCVPLSQVKDEIKKGKFDDMREISDVELYKNAKRQWRLKFTIHNQSGQKTKKFNLLAAVQGKDVFVNKKSWEYSVEVEDEVIHDV